MSAASTPGDASLSRDARSARTRSAPGRSTRTRSSEEQTLSDCAAAARATLRADARALELHGDRALVELGAARHPVAACALAATAGALLGKLGAAHAGSALRRGGSAAFRALRWSSLLV